MAETLHIYEQHSEHMPAQIIGTKAGLMVLRMAIDSALKGEMANARVMQNDGEHYDLDVRLVDDSWMKFMPNPYQVYADNKWTEVERSAFQAAMDGRAGGFHG